MDLRLVVTDFDLDALGEGWEDLSSAARAIADAHDRNRWALGDIGLKVVRRYGEDSLAAFVADIKKVRPSTMYDYCRISKFYPRDIRDLFPALSWSHYREAARLGALQRAINVLEQAQDEDMTVESLHALVNELLDEPLPPQKVAEFEATADAVEEQLIHFRTSSAPDLRVGQEYIVRVYIRRKEEPHAEETE